MAHNLETPCIDFREQRCAFGSKKDCVVLSMLNVKFLSSVVKCSVSLFDWLLVTQLAEDSLRAMWLCRQPASVVFIRCFAGIAVVAVAMRRKQHVILTGCVAVQSVFPFGRWLAPSLTARLWRLQMTGGVFFSTGLNGIRAYETLMSYLFIQQNGL
jgi:hypothetical protein